MNYLQLQEEVERNVIDLPTVVQEGVPNFVNRAMRTLQNRHNFKVMELEADFYTAVGERALYLDSTDTSILPPRFKEWHKDPFFVTDDGEWRELTIASNPTAVRRLFADDDEGAPEVLVQANYSDENGENTHSELHVWPLPDGNSDYDDGEYQLVVPYIGFLTPLSGDNDDNWFTLNAEEWLIFQATAEAFFADWDENRGAIWAQRAASKMDEVKMLDKRYRLGGVRELVPQWQGARKPFVRR